MLKLLDSNTYHLWTDALHARALARQTTDDWDRASYVRWAINTAWTAYEMACEEALNTSGLGNRFKDKFDEAAAKIPVGPVNWGSGVWQQVLTVYAVRKKFVHVSARTVTSDLMPPVTSAESAIQTLRSGLAELSQLVGRPSPAWAIDDDDSGWKGKGRSGTRGYAISKNASEDDPLTVRVTYDLDGVEHVGKYAPAGSDPAALVEEFVLTLNCPATQVRAYVAGRVVVTKPLKARGP